MSRTQGQVQGDTGYGDGHIFIPAIAAFGTGTAGTWTRAGSGLVSLALGNSATTLLEIPLSLIFRYGQQDWLQEQFGSGVAGGAQGKPVMGFTALVTSSTTAAASVNVPVNTSVGFAVGDYVTAGGTQQTYITAIPDGTHITLALTTATLAVNATITQNIFTTPAGVTGTPPFKGGGTAPPAFLTPLTAPRPKGIGIRAIYPVYSIAGAALTTNTIGISKTVFSPNAAPVVTSILTDAANGLATATNAQPYLTPINFATPIAYQTTKFAEYIIEWDITTAGGGTANVYGIFLDLLYNYV
jgi:hypothetical protein